MGKPPPIELQTRVVAFVDEGHGHREAARHFRVSPKFVNDLIKLRCETGSLLPRPQRNGGGHGKLAGVTGWRDARVTAKGEITLDALVAELAETHGIDVHRGTVWRVLRGLGLTHKKTCRRLSRSARTWPPCAASGSRNISASSTKPGPDQHGQDHRPGPARATLLDHAPFGQWRTQTFIGALRHDRLDAPWVIDGAMNGEMLDRHLEPQQAPTLRAGAVVILDNLSSHKNPSAARALRDIGTWFLFRFSRNTPHRGPFLIPPPDSPDLNPMERNFSKLKAVIRKAAAGTYDELWQAVGQVCDLFSDDERYNQFRAAGYEAN